MTKKRILVVGSSNTDMILKVGRIPKPGETVLGGSFSTAAGGKGANQAVAAARAGGSVTFVARVGQDSFGEAAIEGFRRDGIDVRFVFRDERAPSAVAFIFVAEDGENSIGVAPGANENLSPEDVKRAECAFERADIVLVQLEIPLQTVQTTLQLAKRHHVPAILNPAPARAIPPELLEGLAVLTPNATEASCLTGIDVTGKDTAQQAAQHLLKAGARAVVVTLGAKGCFIATATRSESVPAFRVKPVDSTAAGDVFNGALAVRLAETGDLPSSVRFATAAAALSVTKLGAQPSAPLHSAVEAFLASGD